jgi:hypothetical protein
MKRTELQRAIIEHYTKESAGIYPLSVKAYGGQLVKSELIDVMPCMYVAVRSGKSIAETSTRSVVTYNDVIELICFCENLSDNDQNYHEGLKLIDWIEENTKGILLVNDQPIRIADEISFVGVEDVYPHYALIATLTITAA